MKTKETPLEKARRLSGGTHASLGAVANRTERMATYWLKGQRAVSVEDAVLMSRNLKLQVTPQELLPTFDWETVKKGFEKRKRR